MPTVTTVQYGTGCIRQCHEKEKAIRGIRIGQKKTHMKSLHADTTNKLQKLITDFHKKRIYSKGCKFNQEKSINIIYNTNIKRQKTMGKNF